MDAGVKMDEVTITWDSDHQEFESPSDQTDAMRSEFSRAQIAIDPIFAPRSRRDGHFHDRVVVAQTIDEGVHLAVRWDITSGIDNLMSVPKECSVFLEVSGDQ